MTRPPARGTRSRARPWALMPLLASLAATVAIGTLLASCGSTPVASSSPTRQYSSPASIRAASRVRLAAADQVTGLLSARGGPYLTDRWGRVIVLHGVNAVYKRPPYELTVAPHAPWNFDAADARRIAALGFDVVRLGILWQGIEPGHGTVNEPAVCTPGPPGDPHLFDRAVADAYLAKVARTVDLLGRYHVYTLLDMHQDVYSQVFAGEGAPTWAVCTGGQPAVITTGRWSRNYSDPALAAAMQNFWTNGVVGDLQGQYDLVWSTVARAFAHNPWVVGYDPFNEPFSPALSAAQSVEFATELECFYTGRGHPGSLDAGGPPVHCPAGDPVRGVVPTIEAADPHHLVFVEPDIYGVPHGPPSMLGPMPFPRLVFNFHDYCGARSPTTGNPTTLVACVGQELQSLSRLEQERPLLASAAQPGGPPAFLSEFGATGDPALLQQLTAATDQYALGWAYWSWKYYGDPTGSSAEALVGPTGALAPTAAVLSATYAQAVAGTPVSVSSTPLSGRFDLAYTPTARVGAPTVVFVARSPLYRKGYCTTVRGGAVESVPGARHLVVGNPDRSTQIDVTVAPGRCR